MELILIAYQKRTFTKKRKTYRIIKLHYMYIEKFIANRKHNLEKTKRTTKEINII